jgi:hypothetical protein
VQILSRVFVEKGEYAMPNRTFSNKFIVGYAKAFIGTEHGYIEAANKLKRYTVQYFGATML